MTVMNSGGGGGSISRGGESDKKLMMPSDCYVMSASSTASLLQLLQPPKAHLTTSYDHSNDRDIDDEIDEIDEEDDEDDEDDEDEEEEEEDTDEEDEEDTDEEDEEDEYNCSRSTCSSTAGTMIHTRNQHRSTGMCPMTMSTMGMRNNVSDIVDSTADSSASLMNTVHKCAAQVRRCGLDGFLFFMFLAFSNID